MPLLALLLFALVAELGGQTSKRAIIAALADPLSLLSERSPGLRGAGTLLSTKGAPHERVLSGARDRQSPPPIPDVVASIPIVPPHYDTTLAENRLPGLPAFVPGSLPENPPPEGLLVAGANPTAPPPRAIATTPLETTIMPEPASWTMVGGPLAVGILVRQYVRKRRPI